MSERSSSTTVDWYCQAFIDDLSCISTCCGVANELKSADIPCTRCRFVSDSEWMWTTVLRISPAANVSLNVLVAALSQRWPPCRSKCLHNIFRKKVCLDAKSTQKSKETLYTHCHRSQADMTFSNREIVNQVYKSYRNKRNLCIDTCRVHRPLNDTKCSSYVQNLAYKQEDDLASARAKASMHSVHSSFFSVLRKCTVRLWVNVFNDEVYSLLLFVKYQSTMNI